MTDDTPLCMLWHRAWLGGTDDTQPRLPDESSRELARAVCAGRRAWLRRALAIGVGALTLAAGLACRQLAAADAKLNGPSVDLKTMLEKGLRVKRPADFQFIAHVVRRVDDGTLPSSLVKSSFLWSRNKRPYPFVYFQRSLEQQAKKRGIAI